VPDGDESVCERCGLVVDEYRIDHGPDWYDNDSQDDSTKRTGGPLTPTRHDRGLSTKIGHQHDANGNPLSSKKRGQLARLRREQKRGRFETKAERNLAHGLTEVQRLTSALELSESLREQACQLFRTAQSKDLLKGRSIERIASAAVYATCRSNQTPRTLDDIADPAHIDAQTLRCSYNTLNTELGIPAPPRSPVAFISRFANDLDVPTSVRTTARELAAAATDAGVATGCDPTGVAGACLYHAAQQHDVYLTEAAVGDVVNSSSYTIRTHAQRLAEIPDT